MICEKPIAQKMQNCPEHVLIIPDGNRRFAKSNELDIYDVYEISSRKITDIVEWIFSGTGCRTVSIFALGADNVRNRHSKDIESILKACSKEFIKWANSEMFRDKGIRVKIIGDTDGLPDYFLCAKQKVEEATSENNRLNLNILAGYSGRMDIEQAAKMTAPNETQDIIKKMMITEYIDMIIRTSSVMRVSDCPLYQMAYSELVFIDKFFPDIEKEDISDAFRYFSSIKRNKGS